MTVLDLQNLEVKASVSGTGARNSGASKGCPIIIGRQKLPSTVGTTGTKKKNTMIAPCIVNSLL